MSLVKFNSNRWPWNYGLSDIFDDQNVFNDNFFTLEKSMPAMNIVEHENDFEIELASPGFEKKDFEITLRDDLLEVSAKKEIDQEKKKDQYTRKEFNYHSFRRAVRLPKTVDNTKDVKASYENGILKLQLLKRADVKPIKRKINVV
ncbi:Hsp20/alpha crystallin family protein [Pareuzebyella sediminis]|uniref:Hsp20/alpha crystallin family protein n=1 Tax=Pareuzebyella sediminis TaxID=2607998 RepID=UPI0011EF9045|nr:Hsp20/alpha crystallin family protein [Pareuzebyella sediminis]